MGKISRKTLLYERSLGCQTTGRDEKIHRLRRHPIGRQGHAEVLQTNCRMPTNLLLHGQVHQKTVSYKLEKTLHLLGKQRPKVRDWRGQRLARRKHGNSFHRRTPIQNNRINLFPHIRLH
ncbi:replication-associated protein [Tick-associated circular DNA virus]|nr:replication-associated protein [Tick-associated circular DNA virus]